MRKAIYTLLLIAALGHIALGQQNKDFIEQAQQELAPPTVGVTGSLDGTGKGVVGAIGGVVDVGGLGAATYTIPL